MHTPNPEGTLLERLRFRAGQAAMNDRNITAALHREAADEIEALQAKVSEDRETRWMLRSRLDRALAVVEAARYLIERYEHGDFTPDDVSAAEEALKEAVDACV